MEGFLQRRHADCMNSVHRSPLLHILPRKQKNLHSPFLCLQHHGQNASHRCHHAVQRKASRNKNILHCLLIQKSHCNQNSNCDRKIGNHIPLRNFCRCQIYRNPFRRQMNPRIAHGNPHALPGLAHLCGNKSDHGKHRKAV